jgi:hypothetical protein
MPNTLPDGIASTLSFNIARTSLFFKPLIIDLKALIAILAEEVRQFVPAGPKKWNGKLRSDRTAGLLILQHGVESDNAIRDLDGIQDTIHRFPRPAVESGSHRSKLDGTPSLSVEKCAFVFVHIRSDAGARLEIWVFIDLVIEPERRVLWL